MSGTVKYAGWESPTNEKKGFGLYIVIKNGPYETYYAHLQKGSLRVKTGDKVRRGMVIAKSGSTGASTGGHLHYEVRVGRAKRDPKDFGVYPGAVWQT
jgi:murein DD-endopeptidase MepM/ murein hydrolase activator NlpD